MIRMSLRIFEKYTCIKFLPWNYDDDFIWFKDLKNGCYSGLGRKQGAQYISIDRSNCIERGAIMHEVIHALGYTHMQNHADRDKYVMINWNNIHPMDRRNFEKVENAFFTNYKTPYDYYSIMHYDIGAFAIDKSQYTMYPLDPKYADIIGKMTIMSTGDARRINRMYKCENVQYN
jgi:hypothetical protein